MFSPSSHHQTAQSTVVLIVCLLGHAAYGQEPAVVSDSAKPLPAVQATPVPPPVASAEATELAVASEPLVVTASATEPAARSLQSILLKAKGELNATTLPNLDVSKRDLQSALVELENFLGLGTQNGQAWNGFLRLDELRAELAKEQSVLSNLVDLEMNMRQNYLGLEYQQFTRVRDKLNQHVRAVRYGSNPETTIQLLSKKIDDLVEGLNTPVDGTGLERSSQVGVVTNYLHESGQVPWAVSQMRGQFNTPNIQVYARESLINRMLMRPVAQPSPVDECILGTRILGQACLLGTVSADVVPMHNGVSMLLNMSATMTSQNKGYNRGVVLNTTGSSPIFASKQIYITPNGVSSSPATAYTNLQSNIESIEHRLRIVRRIAEKKAAQQKPQADSIAQGRLHTKVRTQYDEQVTSQLAEASGQLATIRQARPEMQRIGFPKPSFAVYSTDSSVGGNMVQAASYQLAASNSCPIPKPASAEIVVEGHQSAAINALDIVLGGRTIRSENLDEYVQQIFGEVPEDVRAEAAGEAWSITFASFHPVEFEFDNDRVKIILRIGKMTRGEQILNDSAIIAATYEPSFQDGVLTLRRNTDVEISFAGNSRGVRVVTLRSFLKGKFETTFKPEIVTKRIDLVKQFPNAPKLEIDSIKLDDGWVQVGLR